ncbi:hypothetical protein ACFP51_02940 [Streptomyces pratens]|uniref:Uncharacterized protein n=1 Tax=Streptomyces pratens TaxID=887456 RepID=A0ABW1M6Z5_9ACTN
MLEAVVELADHAVEQIALGGSMPIRERYQAVLEADQRGMLTIPGVLLVGAACAVLAAGELRRADRGVAPSR